MRDQQPAGEWNLEVSRAERRTWLIQRIGWAVMAAVALGALLGGLGGGPLARREFAAEGVRLEWPGTVRLTTPARLTVRAVPSADSLALTLDNRLLEGIALERWTPAPVRTAVTAGGIVAVFASEPGDTVAVVARLLPERLGRQAGTVGVDGVDHRISLLVLP